jgi:hypothetical protein
VSHTTSEWSTGSYLRQPAAAPDQGSGYANDPATDQAAEAHALGWISIRNAAIGRLRKLSHGHSTLAIEPPRGRVPGPHALAYLYAFHSPMSSAGSPVYEVAGATRVVDDNDATQPGHNVRDLALFLAGMLDVAWDRVREGGFDPRTSMTDRADPMPARAEYVGIAVSSLGEPGEDWSRSRLEAIARGGLLALNLPAFGLIRLVDGTWISTVRPPGEVHMRIRSSEHLDWPGRATYGWTLLPQGYVPPQGSPEYWLAELSRIVEEHAGPAHHDSGRRR